MDEMAALHYRVERTSSDDVASLGTVAKQLGRRVAKNWYRPTLGLGRAGSDAIAVNDVVRLFDREGRVRFEQTFNDRSQSEAMERRVTGDLLALDKTAFEARYAVQPVE
jgi:hypothetical protein